MVSPPSPNQPPLRVALLLYPGCMPAGLFAAADMARAASLRAQASVMDICWAGVDRLPVPTWQGPALAPAVALQQAEADVVLVPGLWLSSPDQLQELLMLPRPRTAHPAFAGHDLMTVADADLRRAMLWVQRSPATDLRLPALAKALGLSPRTLARRVQAHTGLTAALWMRRIKLRQASEALCDTPLPLKRIAEDLGFASEAGLHRAFRQATGQTPLAYRMAHGAR